MRTIARHVPTAARLLLGLIFVTFGANFYLHFLPQPPAPPDAAAFLGALFGSGFIFGIVKPVEIVAGALLLSNRFVPLALTVLAPVVVGIVGYHLALDPAGSGPALLVLALELSLAYVYRDAYAPLFRARTTPRPLGAPHIDLPRNVQQPA